MRLRKRFCLANDADVVFECENFSQAGAKDGLGIGQDYPNQLAAAAALVNPVILSNADRSSRHQFCTLCPLEMVFVNNDANPAPSLIFKAADHAAAAVDLYIASRSHD